MSKEFEEYIADKPGLNLIPKEEVSLLKIKLGKSHRKESDWETIKEILQERDLITFIPPKKASGLTAIENILCERGYLIAFSNIDDCTQHIYEVQRRVEFHRYVQIVSVPFFDVLDIADQHGIDVLIDVSERSNSKCFMYSHKEKKLNAVIMAQF